jgi:predicted ArsR family transcriptional regulator
VARRLIEGGDKTVEQLADDLGGTEAAVLNALRRLKQEDRVQHLQSGAWAATVPF